MKLSFGMAVEVLENLIIKFYFVHGNAQLDRRNLGNIAFKRCR